jgi:hypothetical protein
MPHTWESFGNALGDMNRATRDLREANEQGKTLDKLREDIESLEGANASNLAEKNALRVALAQLDPKHPLLTNVMLKEQLHKQAERVFHINRNWDDVARYGKAFKY